MITLEELENDYLEEGLKFAGLKEVNFVQFVQFMHRCLHTIGCEVYYSNYEPSADMWFDYDDPDDAHIWAIEIYGESDDDSENKYYINESLI